MRHRARWSFLVWGVLAIGAGCGQSTGSTGSNTNWLTRCNADNDCGLHGTCWCGACTKSCGDADACHDGSCHASDELGCGTPSGKSVCVAVCTTSADCPENGAGVECVNGACLPAESPTGGTGATGGGGEGAGAQSSGGGGAGGSAAGAGSGTGGGGTAGGPSAGGPLEPGGAKLAVSSNHTCYVWNDGSENHLDCWGGNLYGQSSALLPGRVDPVVAEPRRVNIPDPVAVAVSENHSCAITSTGAMYCWGAADHNQTTSPPAPADTCPSYVLDAGPDADHYDCNPEPVRITGTAFRIALASGRSCGLLPEGDVFCVGDTAGGPNGTRLDPFSNARSLSIAPGGACTTNDQGALVCNIDLPASPLPPLSDIAYSQSGGFACTLGTDGLVRCFGDDSLGQLGTGMAIQEHGFPSATSDTVAIAVGAAHACALGTDGKVRCWGRNTSGAIDAPPRTSPGCGGAYCESRPLEIAGLPPIVEIAAGGDRTCAAAADRTLWCWGQGPSQEGALVERVGGPWEPGPAKCWDRVSALGAARRAAIVAADRTCKSDADCVTVSVDLSCAHSCALESVSRGAAAGLASAMRTLEADYCADGAGCSAPAAFCDTPVTVPFCMFGTCTQAAPDHSGCADACGCAAVVSANSTGVWKDECSGFDLWPILGAACANCESATSAIVVGNRGGATFNGEATLSFEHTGGAGDPPLLPDPVTVTLSLAPGAVSAPIHVPSTGEGGLTVRVTANGDCTPANDASTYADFPNPTSSCDNP